MAKKTSYNMKKLFENHNVKIVISIIIGLGLASLFRKVCTGNNCIIVKSPPLEELEKYYYKIENNCYKYEPVATECD
jgi:hypothetical protein